MPTLTWLDGRRGAGRLGAQALGLLAALGLSACAIPADEEIARGFVAVHRPLYAPVPLERDALWDHLAQSLVGDALTEHYVDAWARGRRSEREGVRSDVLRVDHDRVEVVAATARSATVEAAWSVGGRVRHRGHEHLRIHRYVATFELLLTDRGWRIAHTRLRDVQRASESGDALFELATEGRGGFPDALDVLRATEPEAQ